MDKQRTSLAFRWVLPVVQLLICLSFLWPSRYVLLFELSQSARSYAPAGIRPSSSPPIEIDLPSLTPEQQKAAEKTAKLEDLRMGVPVMLNFPVVIVQLPYILASPTKREWIPKGMQPEVWRALSWPFAGILFWWCAGRGIEALRAARKAVVDPRMTLAEIVFAALFFCIGVVTLVGILTSTPDDRRDFQFLMFLAGGILWGILASFVIVARFFQWRIERNAAAAMLK